MPNLSARTVFPWKSTLYRRVYTHAAPRNTVSVMSEALRGRNALYETNSVSCRIARSELGCGCRTDVFGGRSARRSGAESDAAASGGAKSDEGFYPGWNLGTRFEGSTSGDGSVYNLGFGGGYNFSHHFGVSLGIPYYFVGAPSAVKAKDPQAVSGRVWETSVRT